jgi:hypothetical protein
VVGGKKESRLRKGLASKGNLEKPSQHVLMRLPHSREASPVSRLVAA